MHKELAELINSNISGANAEALIAEIGDSSITVDASKVKEVCLFLRDNDKFSFNSIL